MQLTLSFIYGYKPRIEKNVHDIMVVVVVVVVVIVVSLFSVQPVRKISIR
jgi:hypothetical protein